MPSFEISSDKIMTERLWKILHKELTRYRDAAISTGKDSKYVHDYYLISIGWMCGLRISEVAALNWEDIGEDQWLRVRNGKGGKSRNVLFGPKTEKLILDYRAFKEKSLTSGRELKQSDPVFMNVHRKRYGLSGISRRMKFWVQKSGLPEKLSYHSLRHGFATRLLNAGMPLHEVRDALGHSSVSVTSAYLHLTEDSRDRFRRLL